MEKENKVSQLPCSHLQADTSRNEYSIQSYFRVFIKHSGTVSTSVPCERLFSKTGEILSQRRSRLSADKVKKILFIKSNS
nr:unnamed protein product [Callosobruchus analis]